MTVQDPSVSSGLSLVYTRRCQKTMQFQQNYINFHYCPKNQSAQKQQKYKIHLSFYSMYLGYITLVSTRRVSQRIQQDRKPPVKKRLFTSISEQQQRKIMKVGRQVSASVGNCSGLSDNALSRLRCMYKLGSVNQTTVYFRTASVLPIKSAKQQKHVI